MKKKRNAQPEYALQRAVRRMLMMRAPELMWIGGAAGMRLPPSTVSKARATGILNRGWPDVTLLCPDGIIRAIELKADEKGALSPEQEAFRDICAWSGRDVWALCWTVAMVANQLTAWGIALKPEGVDMSAWDDGLTMAEAFE